MPLFVNFPYDNFSKLMTDLCANMSHKHVSRSKVTTLNNSLEELFEFAPPRRLTKSLHHVFFNYLQEAEKVYPENFKEIASDFYFLILFLQKAEDLLDEH